MPQTPYLRRSISKLSIIGLAVLTTALTLTGCGGSNSGEKKCPDERIFSGERYTAVNKVVHAETSIGKASYTPCDDGGGPESGTATVWSIVGLNPEEAVAVGPRDNARQYVASDDDDWSPELKKLTKD